MVGLRLVHVLGAGDLGVSPAGFPQRLTGLLEGNASVQDAVLAGQEQTADGAPGRVDGMDHHGVLRPIPSALLELDEAGFDTGVELLLVATRHQPVNPMDTLTLAQLLARRLDHHAGALFDYGTIERVSIVEVTAPTLVPVRLGVRAALGAPGTPEAAADRPHPEVAQSLSSGGVGAFLGATLGCVDAGFVPLIVEANRQDTPADTPRVRRLLVEHDTARWLGSTAQFGALADLKDAGTPEVGMLQALDAVQRLDWERLGQVVRESGPDGPWGRLLADTPPADSAGWDIYLEALTAALCWRLARSHRSALHLLRPNIDVRFSRLQSDALRRGEQVEHTQAIDYLRSAALLRQLPQTIRDLLDLPQIREVWRIGRQADHGGSPDQGLTSSAAQCRELGWHVPSTNRFLDLAVQVTGQRPAPAGRARLVVQSVGRRDVSAGSTPMLDAVLDALAGADTGTEGSGPLLLRLLASEETSAAAATMVDRACECGVDAAVLLQVSDPYGYVGVRDEALAALEALDAWDEVSTVWFVSSPGTKALNLGGLAALLTAAFNRARAVQLASVVGDAQHDSRFVADPEAVLPRLAHDTAVAELLPRAVAALDLGSAQLLATVGSSRWEPVREQLAAFHLLALDASVTPQDLDRIAERPEPTVPPARALWRARMLLWRQLADQDPARAVYTAVTVCEQTFGTDWRYDGKANTELWQARNRSPMGHEVWAFPPSKNRARTLLREVLDHNQPDGQLPDGALRDQWHRLQDAVGQIAAEVVATGATSSG